MMNIISLGAGWFAVKKMTTNAGNVRHFWGPPGRWAGMKMGRITDQGGEPVNNRRNEEVVRMW